MGCSSEKPRPKFLSSGLMYFELAAQIPVGFRGLNYC